MAKKQSQQTETEQSNALVYAKPEGMSHTEYLRTLLTEGHAHDAIKTAYATARFAEYRAKDEHAKKDDKELKSFLRKHAGNHLKLALADLNPMSAQEKARVLDARIERLSSALEKAQQSRSTLAVAV